MKLRTMMKLGKQAGTLKADHPAAWATGEMLAVDLLAERSETWSG